MVTFKHNTLADSGLPIAEILEGTITGTVLNNAISPTVAGQIKDSIPELKSLFDTDLNDGNGFSLPGMFGQLHKYQTTHLVDTYFNQMQPFVTKVDQLLGYNFGLLLQGLLQQAFKPFNAQPFTGLLPYSIRVVYPGSGGLSLHKDGDLLPLIHERVSDTIQANIQGETMMSWYFTLQAPEQGGELMVLDPVYSNYTKPTAHTLLSPSGEELPVSQAANLLVKPSVYSLLMFKGGSHWHSVLPPQPGSSERITLGGFMAVSKNGQSLLFWS